MHKVDDMVLIILALIRLTWKGMESHLYILSFTQGFYSLYIHTLPITQWEGLNFNPIIFDFIY